jgi:DNA repair protein RecO (recombination protein O)
MLLSSEGIVLTTVKYGESSYISKVFSEKKGIVSLISNRSKSRKNKSHLFHQPFILVDFVCYFKNTTQVHRIKEISYSSSFQCENTDVIKNSIRFFIAEFLSKVIKEEEQNYFLYNYIKEQLLDLYKSPNVNPNFPVIFLSELMKPLGVEPNLTNGSKYFDFLNGEFLNERPKNKNYIMGEESQVLYNIISNNAEFKKTDRKTALNNLLKYYSCQLDLDIKMKSQEVLEAVFS